MIKKPKITKRYVPCTSLLASLFCCLLIMIPGSYTESAPKKCYLYNTDGGGFGSNVQGVIMAVAVWGAPGNTIYINEQLWRYKCTANGSWEYFFKGVMPQRLPASGLESVQGCEHIAYQVSFEAFRRLAKFNTSAHSVDNAFQMLADATARVWTLSDRVRGMAEKQYEHYNVLKKPLAGIHIRAGDKFKEDTDRGHWEKRKDWALNFKMAAFSVSMYPVSTCLMFGDQWPALWDAMAAMHGEGIRCNLHLAGGTHEGHFQADFNVKSEEERCTDTMVMVMNIDALARTDLFMGSMNSNIPRLVLQLRSHLYHKAANTSSDATGSYSWHYDWQKTLHE